MLVVIGLFYNIEENCKVVGFFLYYIKFICVIYRWYVNYKKSVDIRF